MTTVSLNSYTVRKIMHQTEQVLRKNAGAKKLYPATAPDGVGDELSALLLPPKAEKEARDLLPDYMYHLSSCMYVGVEGLTEPYDTYVFMHRPAKVLAPFKEKHIAPLKRTVIRNAPGIEYAEYDGNGVMNIKPATDGSKIESDLLRTFVEDMQAIGKYNADLEAGIKKDLTGMGTFLAQHRTLQSAVEKFGAGLLEFVPFDVKQVYEKPVVPKPKVERKKKEKVEVDLGSLIAHATVTRLNL